MNYMFADCSSLKSLPDISQWNVSNAEYMSCMFSGCFELRTLPDISKWNVINVKKMNSMFAYCCSLRSLPDIFKWKSKAQFNIEIDKIFYGCSPIKRIFQFKKLSEIKKVYFGS